MLDAILIAGPTASGKSALAISLAQKLGGAVINADSMQVYEDLYIITARPTAAEAALVPHFLFGHASASVNYSAGHWISDVQKTLGEVRQRGLVPIIAGGTGLYFKAMLEGLSDIPGVPGDIRARIRGEALGEETPVLHARLTECDPLTAQRLKPNDRQRILRALEVFAATGLSITSFHAQRGTPLLEPTHCLCIFLAPSRAELYARIDQRFDSMIAQGAIEEVKALAARRLDPALPAMRAHGVPGLLAWLKGEMTLDEAIIKGKADTRHYSKRQFTWFRHQMPGFEWLEPGTAFAKIIELLADDKWAD